MARPSLVSKQARAETWMQEAFGRSMRDHVRATGYGRISTAVVDVDRIMKLSKAPGMLRDWAAEDQKSPAGAKAKITATSVFALLILQKLLGRPTLLTEIQTTFTELSARQLAVLGITHSPKEDEFLYDRIWAAVKRLIKVVDQYPGPRKYLLTAADYRDVLIYRKSQNCSVKRDRMFELANALIGATLLMLPPEVRARWDGNVAVDATYIALGGKRGNPNADNLRSNRWSCNYDGGFYRPEGAHGAYAHDDVTAKVKGPDGKIVKSTPEGIRKWGIELEVARMASNAAESESFPLLTVAVSFHRPSEIKREAARLVEAIQARGDKVNYLILDRAYPNGLIDEFALPLRMKHGVKLVFDYKVTELDVQTFNKGLVQVAGSWYIDSLPQALRSADKDYEAVRDTYRKAKEKAMPAERRALRDEFDMESELHRKQLTQRDKYRLKLKGLMADNGDRRYLLPLSAPGFAKWRAQSGTPNGATLTLRNSDYTDKKALTDANRGGLKREQHLVWASEQWAKIYGLRNSVESANRSIKRSQYEDLGNADNRQVRGNTFTYLISAIAAMSENLRAIIDFFKDETATKPVTSKNKNQASIYFSSTEDGPGYRLAPPDAA